MGNKLKIKLLEDYFIHRPVIKSFLIARLGDEQLAEDILQEMYLKLDRSTIENVIEKPLAYFYRVANNLVFDYRKAEKRKQAREHNWSDSHLTLVGNEIINETPEPEEAIDARRKVKLLNEGIKELPPKCRVIFEACKINGMTYREAAMQNNISVGTVEKHISKALKFLIKYIDWDNYEN